MRIIRHPVKNKLHRPVVALGTFDGVHLGHKKVIEAAVSHARRLRAHSAVITFDPHPQEVVAPKRGLRLLTTLTEREEIFTQLGADAAVVSLFTKRLQKLSYSEYVRRYLVKRLGVRQVFVGYDYSFGRNRTGSPAELKELGRKYNFGVTVVPPVKIGRRLVKSSIIRELLARGDFSPAIKMLGRPYRLCGKVVRGVGRGKRLGFPTANLQVDPRKLIPAQGIYAGFVDGKKCLVYIGSRPTFGPGCLTIEVYILNFSQNIRGQTLRVDLFARLRGDRQFADAEELKEQIKKDIDRARAL